jgi:hypothetical protein
MLIIGAIGLVIIILVVRFQTFESSENMGPMVFIGSLVFWQFLALSLRALTYSGGTIEQIAMQETIADIVAYALVVGFLICMGIPLIRHRKNVSSKEGELSWD